MTTPLPYGSWPSPVSAADTARGSARLGNVAVSRSSAGTSLWWSASRPADDGRTGVTERRPDGTEVAWAAGVTVAGGPLDVRSRLHEYGGLAWLPVGDALVVSSFSDSRLYRLDGPGGEAVPLTPEPSAPHARRYAEPVLAGDRVICVRESHGADGAVSRALVSVPVHPADGPPPEPSVLWEGSDFLAAPRLSPDSSSLAWLTWDHPRMPWDGTELRLATVGPDGALTDVRTLAGGPSESLVGVEWGHDGTLYACSDATGWWNLYRVGESGLEPLWPVEQECGMPLWLLGFRTFLPLGSDAGEHAGRLAVLHGRGTWSLDVLDPGTGELHPLGLPQTAWAPYLAAGGGTLLAVGGGATSPLETLAVPLAGGPPRVLEAASADLPAAPWLPVPRTVEVPSARGRVTHAHVYPPTSPDAVGAEGERPPYVMVVHGGPTSQSQAVYDAEKVFFTSRGIGVVDVDYGGSTGYGRAYRDALQGEWGVVDVEDCVAVAGWLGEQGLADPARVVIRGGSAGGWTVLSALVRTAAFAAGASYFGVAELERFAADTHDFESRYLDGLIGPLPEAAELYRERAPLTHADALAVPVLLLQGLDDKVVPPSQSEMFRDAAARNGVPHAYLAFAGEGHGFRRPDTIVAALEAELSFYGQVLGFTPVGVPTLALQHPEATDG